MEEAKGLRERKEEKRRRRRKILKHLNGKGAISDLTSYCVALRGCLGSAACLRASEARLFAFLVDE